MKKSSAKARAVGRSQSQEFLPYSTQAIDRHDVEAVSRAVRSDFLTQGPLVDEFEKALARRVGAKYAVVVNSGTAALHLATLALELPDGFRAATPAVSFVSSANCIVYAGGRPVFVDVEPDTAHLALERLERVTARRKVSLIIPVHLSGQACAMPEVARIAKACGARVLEDATHALGVNHPPARGRGRMYPVGSCRFSDCAVFSFHAIKVMTTGEGGAITTNSKRLRDRCRRLRTLGITREPAEFATDPATPAAEQGPWYYEMTDLGFNYRLSDMQCALGLSQLKKLDRLVKRRRDIARRYTARFAGHAAFACPPAAQVEVSANHLYVIRLALERLKCSRRRIFDELRAQGLGVNVHYIPIVNQPYYRRQFGTRPEKFPGAQEYYERAISIPLFPTMSRADEERVIATVDETTSRFLK
ncbi:UDP-4-amino-4,6-dideoxy-N-acetyl-beta-L-altrosamine transaminase [Candidatus Sumerlaeota bacterium]